MERKLFYPVIQVWKFFNPLNLFLVPLFAYSQKNGVPISLLKLKVYKSHQINKNFIISGVKLLNATLNR